jgi:hypothetical protein
MKHHPRYRPRPPVRNPADAARAAPAPKTPTPRPPETPPQAKNEKKD